MRVIFFVWWALVVLGVPAGNGISLFFSEGDIKFWSLAVYAVWFISQSRLLFRAEERGFLTWPHLFLLLSVATSLVLLFASKFRFIGLTDNGGAVLHDASVALYFSIVTWTTLGFGDVIPTPDARVFAAAEAMLGYIFTPILVAAVLYLLMRKQARSG